MTYEPPLRRGENTADLASLNPFPGVGYQRLDPKVRYLWSVGRLIFWGVVTVIFLIVAMATGLIGILRSVHPYLPYLAISVLVLLVSLSILWPFISYPHWGYAWRKTDFLIRFGVIWKQVIAIPFARIQHVDSQAGPMERLFGVANLKVHTPVPNWAPFGFRACPRNLAEDLRDRLSEVGHTHANI